MGYRFRKRISGQIAASVLIVMGTLLMLAALQHQLIYYPTNAAEEQLLGAAGAVGLADWRDGHGQLIGWHSRPTGEAVKRLVVFHGNAGHALHRSYYVNGFLALKQGWQVYLFEYPGYGARQGKPSERDIKEAAENALKLLLDDSASPVYLLGESLGSGVASHLAAKFPQQVDGLLLVTPFTSLPDVAARHYRWLPVRTLLTEQYDAAAALSQYRGPVAFLLAGSDEIVPPVLGQQLHNGYAGPRWLHMEAGAGHNSLNFHPGADWWHEVSDFLTAR